MEPKDWFLLFLSVPIGFAINLVTPRLQKLISSFSQERQEKQEAKGQAATMMWEWFAKNPQVFSLYLLRAGIAIVRNVIALVATAAMFVFLQGWQPKGYLNEYKIGALLACYFLLVRMGFHVSKHSYNLQYAWFKVREINKWPADFHFNPIPANLPKGRTFKRSKGSPRVGQKNERHEQPSGE